MSSGLTETTTEVACFVSPVARLWLRYWAAPMSTALALSMELLMKVNSCSSPSGTMWVGVE